MVTMKRILCPTDFSETSRAALDHAVALARWYEGEITVLHVAATLPSEDDGPPLFPGNAPLDPDARQAIISDLEKFVAPAVSFGVRCHMAIEEGDPARAIVTFAQKSKADVVVLGTHGRGGFERFILGSVVEKVLHRARCPVVSVPPHAQPPSPAGWVRMNNILCATDFSAAGTAALAGALSMCHQADASLTLMHVLEWFDDKEPLESRHFDVPEFRRHLEQEAMERLKGSVAADARSWCKVTEIVAHGKAWKEILRVAQECQVDLIVMGVIGRNPVDLMLFGSTTQQVVRRAACPVFTLRAT